ncbi:MAG: hypothetical protein HOC33_12570 [Alphaproteobacteria bacterium]|jgi:hypothetical protein|nr:hypothetical protein [Alphaproteobacteria bacterium]MBT4084722.1 hypothetical protein [Alphaproteobacteria bacterium]MBT4544678.1 hypothetical protein [Alphaproteobacteria bacterium]
MMSKLNITSQLSDSDIRDLKILAAMIVPASKDYDLPGADDPLIFDDILAAAAPHSATIASAVQALNTIARDLQATGFADLAVEQQETSADTFRKHHAAEAELLEALTVQCYYRDERVKNNLDMDTRPPFPAGFELEQGDWSLLDKVRERPALYRADSETGKN